MLANTVDPVQMPHYMVSDLCLHCLPLTLIRVSIGMNGLSAEKQKTKFRSATFQKKFHPS